MFARTSGFKSRVPHPDNQSTSELASHNLAGQFRQVLLKILYSLLPEGNKILIWEHEVLSRLRVPHDTATVFLY